MSAADMQNAIDLCPVTEATATAVQTGLWSDPATWGGVLPATDAKVVIPPGVLVWSDCDTPKMKWLFVQGDIRPVAGTDCTLWVETIVTDMAGCICTGEDSTPFIGQWDILFADYGPITDLNVLGRGLITEGMVNLCGQQVDAAAFLAAPANVGDTTITLKSAPVGWLLGDKLVLPGMTFQLTQAQTTASLTNSPIVNDDDECTLAGISSDGLTLTLAVPLKFPHGLVDVTWQRLPIPMFVANIAPRSINFRSESTVTARRGHVMLMRSDPAMVQCLRNVGCFDLGRTDKSQLLTDPDGKGGGTANPRARYGGPHFHQCGPDLTGTPGELTGVLVYGSPGWGPVNHDSYVHMDGCLSYKVFGASIVGGEIGTETGSVTNSFAVRGGSGTAMPSVTVSQPNPNADWGRCGHGIFNMSNGVTLRNNRVAGHLEAFGINGLPFNQNRPTQPVIKFATKNLASGGTYRLSTVGTHYVPQRHSGLVCWGCRDGIVSWDLNDNPSEFPLVNRSIYTGCSGSVFRYGIQLGYNSNVDIDGCHFVGAKADTTMSWGVHNSGTSTNINVTDCTFEGFSVGIETANYFDNVIDNCTFLAGTAIHVSCASLGHRRTLVMSNLTFEQFTRGQKSVIDAAAKFYNHRFYFWQGKTQVNILASGESSDSRQFFSGDSEPITKISGSLFPYFCATFPAEFGPIDWVTLDGQQLFFWQEGPYFNLDTCMIPQSTSNATTKRPAIVAGMTNSQMFSRFGVSLFGRILPPTAHVLPGSMAYVSPDQPRFLPEMRVNKSWSNAQGKYNHQMTSQPAGYVATVQDAAGKFYQAAPVNLTDKAWNIVTLQFAGELRGVFVWCDSGATFGPNW